MEGFEIQVLKGAEYILRRDKPWLCIEFNTLLAGTNTLEEWPVHQFMTQLGYVARQFHNALDCSATAVLSGNWQTTGYCNLFYSMS